MGDGSREVRKLGGLEPDDVEGRLHFFGEVVCSLGSLLLLVGVIAAPVGELDRVPRRICFFWFGKPIAGLGDSLVVPPGICMVVYPRCLN